MRQQLDETITPSELQFPEIEAIINFLLTQMTPYVRTNFASNEARTATQDNVIEVIEKLCLDQRAQEATAPVTPTAPAPKELIGKITNAISITANTLASTATTIGRAVGSPIVPAYIDPNQPFHRLQHLQYFAFKAKHLRKLIADLRDNKLDSKLFNDTCDQLIEELTEFFEALRELPNTSDRVFLQVSCNGTQFNITGMAGITGGTTLGTSVVHILDNYKLSKITPEISKQKKLQHSNSLTPDEIENNQSRIRELEEEVERLRIEDTVKTREVAKANNALSNALRSQEATRKITQERDKDAERLHRLELQLSHAQKNVANAQEQKRLTGEIGQLRDKISAQDSEVERLKQEMQTHQKQLEQAKTREADQEREKIAMRLRYEKEIEERKAKLLAQEKQNREMQQTLQQERKNNKEREDAQKLLTKKMQSDHERALERAREMQAEELEKIRAVQLAQEQELTAAREHQLTQARILSELNASNLALTQQNEKVNKLDSQGFNLLHTAIKLNNVEQVESALATANANIKTGDGRSPLCLALVHDDGLGLSLKKDIDANTIKIVGLLLKYHAIASECVTMMNRNFVHFLIFKSVKLTKLDDPLLRSNPNIELIKLFLLNGCDFKSGDSRCGSDIGKFIDKTYKLNDAQTKAREILVTFRRYSVSELCTTLDWQHVLLERYQQLSTRAETSETANKHMMVIRQYFERYSFIFDLLVNPNNRYVTVTKASALTHAFNSKQMEDDIQKLLAIGLDSQNWLQQQPKQPVRRIDSIFIVDSPELARENQLFLQTIITNLIKCIEKAKLMQEQRPVEITEGKFENKCCILTPLEAKVIEMNLPQALEMFRENLEKKRIYEEKQAASIVKK